MLIVEMLARMPDLRRRIYVDHVSDGAGYCRDCQGARWPCEMVQLAAEADRRDGVTPGYLAPRAVGGRAAPDGRRAAGGFAVPPRTPAVSAPAPVDRGFAAPAPPAPIVERGPGWWSGRRAEAEPGWVDGAHPAAPRTPGAGSALPEPRGIGQCPSSPDDLAPRRDRLPVGSDELRARREEARARREQLRASRNGRGPREDVLGRHDFGRDPAAISYTAPGNTARRAEVVDALEDVLRWSP